MPPKGKKISGRLLLLHALDLVFHNIAPKLGTALLFYSNMTPLSLEVAPPLDSRGVSPVNGPCLEIGIIKGLSEICGENRTVALYGGASRGDGSPFGPHLKSSPANVFPVDCELCFFLCGPI